MSKCTEEGQVMPPWGPAAVLTKTRPGTAREGLECLVGGVESACS